MERLLALLKRPGGGGAWNPKDLAHGIGEPRGVGSRWKPGLCSANWGASAGISFLPKLLPTVNDTDVCLYEPGMSINTCVHMSLACVYTHVHLCDPGIP